jgi:hypothetical protein
MDYSILEADLEKSRSDIIEIWRRNFPDMREDRFEWAYLNNPYGKARCWLLQLATSRKTVGAASLLPRRIWVNRESRLAGIAADFCVDKEHRGFKAAVLLQRAVVSRCINEDFDFLYGFPNKNSEAVHRRVGFVDLGRIKRMTKLLRSKRKIAQYVNPAVAGVAAPAVDFVLGKISKGGRRKRLASVLVQEGKGFDNRFDLFWAKANGQFKIIGERDFSFLNWRFTENPHKDYRVFYITENDHKTILGYVVYYVENNICYVSDILFVGGEPVLEILLSEFLIYQRTREIDSVSVILLGSLLLQKKLRSFGFYARKENSVVQIYENKDKGYVPLLSDSDSWLLLEGDRDV